MDRDYCSWQSEICRESREEVGSKGSAGKEVLGAKGSYELREPETAYSCNFDIENGPLSLENAYFWDDY